MMKHIKDIRASSRFSCPNCNGVCRVSDSRVNESEKYKYRRRRYICIDCGTRFTTIEQIMKDSITTK